MGTRALITISRHGYPHSSHEQIGLFVLHDGHTLGDFLDTFNKKWVADHGGDCELFKLSELMRTLTPSNCKKYGIPSTRWGVDTAANIIAAHPIEVHYVLGVHVSGQYVPRPSLNILDVNKNPETVFEYWRAAFGVANTPSTLVSAVANFDLALTPNATPTPNTQQEALL
jgi:hypothetical protein